MTNLDLLIIMRRQKKIRLRQIADYIGCTVSYLSQFENKKVDMSIDKVKKYKDFIYQY